MTDGPRGDLEALIERSAGELDGVERADLGAGREWSTRGVVFACVEGNRGEFRLAPAIVAAALRTPATDRSPRGADWVGFAPVELDGYATDRAVAWLASAWRRAAAGD